DPGVTLTLVFSVTVDPELNTSVVTSLRNTVTVDGSPEGEVEIPTGEPGLTARKSVTDANRDGLASPGEALTYTITVTNSGTVAASSVVIQDDLSGLLDYILPPQSSPVTVAGFRVVEGEEEPVFFPELDGLTVGGLMSGITVQRLDPGVTLTLVFSVTVDPELNTSVVTSLRNTVTVDGSPEGEVEIPTTSPPPAPPPPPPPPSPPSPPSPPQPPQIVDIDELVIPLVLFSPIHYRYLIGDTDGLIRPTDNITRAEVVTIFFRLITDDFREQMWVQSNPYPDVIQRNWFNNAVSTMTNAGVLRGMPNGTFEPNRAITRAEFAAIVSRFIEGEYTGEDYFRDIEGHWAQAYINTLGSRGWVIGVGDGNFEPNREITRAEAATIVNRILVRHPETVADLLPGMITWPDNADTTAWFYLDLQEATNSNSYEMKDDGYHKTWIELIPDPNWVALERPESRPRDHLIIAG
ncbi:MAG: S-layer homology domain-containing protein, partial [Oscillospiraceae bacterium]|nr:S-layer homology domain-containing protein [Oscillospiraceae bacterium]